MPTFEGGIESHGIEGFVEYKERAVFWRIITAISEKLATEELQTFRNIWANLR